MKSFLSYIIESSKPFYTHAAIRHVKTGHILTGPQHYYAIKKAYAHHDVGWATNNKDHPYDAKKLGWGDKYNEEDWEHGFITQDEKFENRDQAEARFGEGYRTSQMLAAAGHLTPLDEKSANEEKEAYEDNPPKPRILSRD